MANREEILARITQLESQVETMATELERLRGVVFETEGHRPPAFRELEAFGMWSDREEMQDPVSWVENLRLAWFDRANRIWGADADASD